MPSLSASPLFLSLFELDLNNVPALSLVDMLLVLLYVQILLVFSLHFLFKKLGRMSCSLSHSLFSWIACLRCYLMCVPILCICWKLVIRSQGMIRFRVFVLFWWQGDFRDAVHVPPAGAHVPGCLSLCDVSTHWCLLPRAVNLLWFVKYGMLSWIFLFYMQV